MDLSGALAVIDTEVPQRCSGSKLLSQLVMAAELVDKLYKTKKPAYFYG